MRSQELQSMMARYESLKRSDEFVFYELQRPGAHTALLSYMEDDFSKEVLQFLLRLSQAAIAEIELELKEAGPRKRRQAIERQEQV